MRRRKTKILLGRGMTGSWRKGRGDRMETRRRSAM
jgi:hypothetical protein